MNSEVRKFKPYPLTDEARAKYQAGKAAGKLSLVADAEVVAGVGR